MQAKEVTEQPRRMGTDAVTGLPVRLWPAACLDLETLATVPRAVVLEIGLVAFDPMTGELGPEFSKEVALRATDQQLRDLDEETLAWGVALMAQGHAMPGMHDGESLRDALTALVAWAGARLAPDALVWAWGMDFDFPILKDGLDEFHLPLPWRYNSQRCARTLCKTLGVERQGAVIHAAAADARQEALAVMTALRRARRVFLPGFHAEV